MADKQTEGVAVNAREKNDRFEDGIPVASPKPTATPAAAKTGQRAETPKEK
jgi:hypothetical protein